MRKTKILACFIIAVIAFVSIYAKVKATSMDCQVPESVRPQQTFNVTFKFSENYTVINGHILYDSSLIELADSNDGIVATNTGDVAILVTTNEESVLTDSYSIKFRAKDVESTSTANFSLQNFVVGTESGNEGEYSNTFSVVIEKEQQIEQAQLTVDKENITIKIAESVKINAQGAGTLLWKSSDESVAVVNDGTVTGVGTGTAAITVADDITSKNVTVNVEVVKEEPKDDPKEEPKEEPKETPEENKNSDQEETPKQEVNTDNVVQPAVSNIPSSVSPRKISKTGETEIIVGAVVLLVVFGLIFRAKSK